jgi:hypothetical protein
MNTRARCAAPRVSFARVPNELNLELNLLALYGAALVAAAWRVLLNCRRRNSSSPLRLVCCARGRVVVYRCRERPPNPPSPLRSDARPHRCAWILCARKRAVSPGL